MTPLMGGTSTLVPGCRRGTQFRIRQQESRGSVASWQPSGMEGKLGHLNTNILVCYCCFFNFKQEVFIIFFPESQTDKKRHVKDHKKEYYHNFKKHPRYSM
jgi:hypothetical protein